MESIADRNKLIRDLRSQSTLRLFVLSMITFGIYESYYVLSRTAILNRHLGDHSSISQKYVETILIINYAYVLAIIPMEAWGGDLGEWILNILATIWCVLVIIWAFKARNCIGIAFENTEWSRKWFPGLWTFLFTAWYFNYKINTMNDALPNKSL